MIGSAKNRAQRGTGLRRVRTAAVAGAAATAMAAGVAVAPNAQALTVDRDYTWDPVYASGLIAGALDLVSKLAPGMDLQLSDTISFHTGPPPALGLNVSTSLAFTDPVTIGLYANIGLTLNLRTIAGDTKNLYNTVGGIPQPGCGNGGGPLGLLPKGYASNCRYAIQLATLGTEFNLLDAYRAQIASVEGNTGAGLIPFTSSPNSTPTYTSQGTGPTYTNQALIILQNPDRPNGGLAARFPGISTALGLNPTMPAAGKVTSSDGKIVLNTTTLDLTWAYDPIGDFPAVFSLPAIVNSIAGALPLNIVTGGLSDEPLQGSSLGDIGLNLASVLQFPLNVTAATIISIPSLPMEAGRGFYSTLVPNVLPLTALMGIPGSVANFALSKLGSKYLLGNPVGDMLAPALKILVNTAYTDVLTPDKLGTCATDCNTGSAKTWADLGYTAYDRSFGAYSAPGDVANAATPTKFNSVDILTPEEKAQKALDVKAAFAAGLAAQKEKPFFGILVPNPAKSAAAKPVTAVAAARTAAPAESDSVDVQTSVEVAPSLASAAPKPGRASVASARKAAAGNDTVKQTGKRHANR